MKSRENLKQYLVTGKINPEEISSLGLTSHKINIDVHQDSTAGVTNDNNQIDFSQDWEKISLNSHNSNLILFNNKKNSSNLNFSGSKQALNPPALNNKMKLQETKTKIDKYFNKNSKSPDHLLKKGLITQLEKNQENIQSSHLKINHIEAVKSFDIKSEKVEKVISTKNIITPKTVIPKIIPHNTDNKNLTLNRPASQSKIHLKKNNVSEMNKK